MSNANAADPPRTVRTATGIWLALAAFCVITALLAWTQHDQIRDALAHQPGMPPDQVDATTRSFLVQNTVVQVLFGAVYAVLAWLLRSGRGLARILLTVVAPLQLLLIVVGGGVSLGAIVVLLLAAAGLWLTWMRASSDHLGRTRES